MKSMLRSFKRLVHVTLALALTLAVVVPSLAQEASAAQMQNRGIEMSDSTPGKTNVTYKLFFNTASVTSATSSIVVDFCSNSPLQGDHCTAVGGTDTPNTHTAAGTGVTPVQDTTSDGTGAQTNTWHTFKLNTVDLSTSPASFTITGITNPSNTGTFYARILVYGTPTGAGSADDYVADGGGAAAAVPTQGSFGDYGGAALSTATLISITAKVEEQLTFCVSGPNAGADPITANCTGAVSPALTLGHGTPTAVLSNTIVDTSPIYSLISTNASQGAIVRMKAGNTCTNLAADFLGGLSTNGGTTCAIEAIDSHGPPPAGVAMTAGSPAGNPGGAFGLCVAAGTANTVPVAPYNDPTGAQCDGATNLSDNTGNGFGSLTTQFGMDDSVTSTYGSSVLNTNSLPVNAEKDTYVFAATASNTTPAGIYTGSESLIATGTF